MTGTYDTAADHYRKTSVQTASPIELVVMLYDGALRFLDSARAAMERRDFEKQNYFLQKVQKIISELMACLDMKQGGEVATNLFAIYNYMLNQLIDANIKDQIELLEPVRTSLVQLRESWAELQTEYDTVLPPQEKPRIVLEG